MEGLDDTPALPGAEVDAPAVGEPRCFLLGFGFFFVVGVGVRPCFESDVAFGSFFLLVVLVFFFLAFLAGVGVVDAVAVVDADVVDITLSCILCRRSFLTCPALGCCCCGIGGLFMGGIMVGLTLGGTPPLGGLLACCCGGTIVCPGRRGCCPCGPGPGRGPGTRCIAGGIDADAEDGSNDKGDAANAAISVAFFLASSIGMPALKYCCVMYCFKYSSAFFQYVPPTNFFK